MEEESHSHTASWVARQGAWTESRDRGGVNRGGLRRTSSGPSRIDSLMMGDLDHAKSVPATSAAAPVVDKKLPSLLLAEDNKVRAFKRSLFGRLLESMSCMQFICLVYIFLLSSTNWDV